MPQVPADSTQVNPDSDQPSQYRFGPFSLDPTRRVLLREGERILLSAKSLDTLLTLVKRYGETATKKDLLEAIWGDAIVEENSLNKCISEVRKALGERRGQHDFIVTMTGVGYRFVAPVTVGPPDPAPAASQAALPRQPKLFYLRVALAAAVLVTVATAIYLLHAGVVPHRRLAVILPLKNLPNTPDTAWLSTAIGEMLYHELAGAPTGAGEFHLIPPEDVAHMDRDLPQRRTPAETLRDIRNYSGADLALAGTVTVLSGEADKPLRIDLRVQDLHSGDILAAKSIDGSEGQTFSLVRGLAEQVRQALGASAPASGARRPPAPTSARAMQFYAAGLAALRSSDLSAAKDRLLEAVAADPSNALCYSALSAAWSGLGYQANAADAARRAFDLSAPLDDLERLAIEARYRLAKHDWPRAAELYEAIWRLVPESIENADALLEAYQSSGRIEDARLVIARLRSQPPPLRDDPRIDLLEAKLAGATWSDFQRIVMLTKQAAEKARGRGMRALYAHARLMQSRAMWSAGIAGSAEVRHEARRLCEELNDSACVALSLRGDGNANFISGRLGEARESYTLALATARQSGNLDEELNELNSIGLLHCTMGDFEAADGYFREAFRIDRVLRRNDSAMLHNNHAYVLTESGQVAEARTEATAGLAAARNAHEVESEADALAALAVLDRVGGDPRHAVVLNRQALALANESGKKLAQVEIQFELALALAATGEADAARDTLHSADAARGSDESLNFELTSALIAFDEADYPAAARLALTAAEDARKSRAPYCEARADSLLALAWLEQGRAEEARAAALRAVTIRQTPERGLSRLEARLADVAARASDSHAYEELAAQAQNAGYIQLALEIRLAAAGHAVRSGMRGEAGRLLRQVVTDAAARGYAALALRARRVQ